MAYQDVAGPLSVKYSVTPADGLRWHVPRDCVATVHRPGGNSGTARPTAGITLVVTMRLGGLPSGGAHRLVLGGNFGDPLRMPADAEPQCSNPTCRSPSGQQPGLDSDSGCRSFGKAQAGLDVRRATSRIAVQYARITPVVALEGAPGLLSGRCGGDFCNGLEATPDRPRRARESHLLWCTTSLRAFFGRRRAESLLLGATPVRPRREGSHACRGTWMRAVALSGAAGRTRSPGACSRAATCENQRFAPVVAWMRPTAPSGTSGTAPGAWNHSPASPRPVRQSAVRNANVPPTPTGGLVCSHPLRGMRSKRWSGAPSASLREVRCEAPCARPLSREV